MRSFEYTMSDPQGLHARNALSLCKLAEPYEASIILEAHGRKADCKNVIALMGLCVKCGDSIRFILDGTDEQDADAGLKAALPTIL